MENLEEIIGFDALYQSMLKCKNGVLWKDSVAHFYHSAPTEILKLSQELQSGRYQPRQPKRFQITCPKRREVMGIAFRDRVYQRSLNDNAVYPQMTRHLIYDNAACQRGKGTTFAKQRLRCFLQRFYRRHGLNGYVLQCDIKGYYPNMPHAVAEARFRKYLDPQIYQMVTKILAYQYDGDRGYYPGSQMIQIAGIAVLDPLDHFIKERLGIKYYLRYMDDFLLIHEDGEYLVECCRKISEELAKIGLELHPKKTKIFPLSKRIKFLGFYHFLTPTGRVVCFVDPDNVKNQRRKLRRLVSKAKRCNLPREKIDECYASWRAHAKQGNSCKLIQRMDAYYKSLWKN